ncbi:hypothetical protein EV356DRAFT_529518 [Viridothelium virens]|uniref:Zn(2)-C6 fungal-type domain-containing protein n=1 Tax=Viridothelium virens TaxID=1048519 RepID=A0A6A6HKH7_VIRVR|nr:hypothetical protein EV356DRAFT_529518 [Viridothelium virens]
MNLAEEAEDFFDPLSPYYPFSVQHAFGDDLPSQPNCNYAWPNDFEAPTPDLGSQRPAQVFEGHYSRQWQTPLSYPVSPTNTVLSPEMSTRHQSEWQQSVTNRLSIANQPACVSEPFVHHETPLLVQPQGYLGAPYPPFDLEQPADSLESCASGMSNTFLCNMIGSEDHGNCQEQAMRGLSFDGSSPSFNSPARSSRASPASSRDNARESETTHHATPPLDEGLPMIQVQSQRFPAQRQSDMDGSWVFVSAPNSVSNTIPFSDESASTVRACPPRTVTRSSLDVRHSRYATTPLSVGKSPSSSGSENPIDTPSPASENSSTRSWQDVLSAVPRQSIDTRVNKRRRLTEAERKNAKMCDGSNPCSRCLANENNARNFFQPCFREDLDDARVVRHGNAQFDQHDVEYPRYKWSNMNAAPKHLELDWFIPGTPGTKAKSPSRLVLSNCRQYLPENDQSQYITWQSHGKVYEEKLPSYAVEDTENLSRKVVDFLNKCQPWVEGVIRNRPMDQISRWTYEEVFRWRRTRPSTKLIDDALQLQYCSIMCQGWASLTDLEDLGIPRKNFSQYGPSTYEEFASNGHRPVPQSIDHQIDVAMLLHMRNIEKRLMRSLKQKVAKNQKDSWYEIFLCYFILLTNLQYIHSGASAYLESQRQTRTENQVSYVIKKMTEEWEHSKGNMMYHFRVILRVFDPFKKARYEPGPTKRDLNLDEEAIAYMAKISRLHEEQGLQGASFRFNSARENGRPQEDWAHELFESHRNSV